MEHAEDTDTPLYGREMTIEEWGALDEDEPGELVDGRLEEEEEVGYEHELCVTWVTTAFRNWLAKQRGFVGGSDAKFRVKPRRGRKPDATVYLPGRAPTRAAVIHIPPDIAIEVMTPTPKDRRRDRMHKMDDYAAFGVRWYWLIDHELRTLEIFELRDGIYSRVLGAESGRVERVPGCEGLVLDLDAPWAELDSLTAE